MPFPRYYSLAGKWNIPIPQQSLQYRQKDILVCLFLILPVALPFPAARIYPFWENGPSHRFLPFPALIGKSIGFPEHQLQPCMDIFYTVAAA